MTTPSRHAQKFRDLAASIKKEISAEEARARKVAEGIDAKKRKFLEDGRAHFASTIADLREQATAALRGAHGELAKLPVPAAPDVDSISDTGLEAYVAACTAHEVSIAEHTSKRAAINRPLFARLRGLHKLANDSSRECRALGLGSLGGAGLFAEHHLRHAQLSDKARQFNTGLDRGEVQDLDAEQCGALVELLAMPAPAPQAPSPEYTAGVPKPAEIGSGNFVERGWQAIVNAVGGES